MDQVLDIVHEMLGSDAWEMIAAVLAVAYLVLAMRRSLWCWLCAFISTVIYIVVMARSGLVMDTLLQIYYLIMAVYGYIEWKKGKEDAGEVRVVTWRYTQHLLAIAVVLALTAINAYALQYLAPMLTAWSLKMNLGYVQFVRSPWLDSLVTWGSVLTTWMVARRILENWLYWIAVDGIAAGLYYSRGLKATAVLFVIYVIMVVYGYFQWRKGNALAEAAA
jgi:nicotinamide mononucleotide transporter